MHTLDRHVRTLTRAAFERYGFAYGELLARWAEIAGEDLAAFTAPERIRWPRSQDGEQDRGQPGGGTLVVRVAEGRGLELHYRIPRIIERINGFYGYTAIAAIKVRQGKIAVTTPGQSACGPDPRRMSEVEARLETIADERLRQSLRRLGAGVLSRSSGNDGEE